MSTANKSAGEKTKAVIFEKALELFRMRGFEVTTMRDIARSAKVATGAAYYYFPSKESIVAAYYDQVQRLHAEKVRLELSGKADLDRTVRQGSHRRCLLLLPEQGIHRRGLLRPGAAPACGESSPRAEREGRTPRALGSGGAFEIGNL